MAMWSALRSLTKRDCLDRLAALRVTYQYLVRRTDQVKFRGAYLLLVQEAEGGAHERGQGNGIKNRRCWEYTCGVGRVLFDVDHRGRASNSDWVLLEL
jgi:hypothetical protein